MQSTRMAYQDDHAKRFEVLEAWRGFAAMMVLFSHVVMVFALPLLPVHSRFASAGETINGAVGSSAVAIFFVISGIVIRISIQRHSQFENFALAAYARARANRILPTFWCALLLSLAVWALAPALLSSPDRLFTVQSAGALPHPGLSIDVFEFVGTSLFLNSVHFSTIQINSPLWSLSYEVWLYVWAAGFGWCNSKLRLTRTMRFVAMASGPVLFTLVRPHFGIMGSIWMVGFVLGELSLSARQMPHRLSPLIAQSLLGLTLAMACANVAFAMAHPGYERLGGIIVEIFAGFSFAAHFLLGTGAANGWLLARFGPISKFSYSLYVFHMPLLLAGFGLIADGRIYSPLRALAGILVALAAFAFAATVGRRIEALRPFVARTVVGNSGPEDSRSET